LDAMLELPYGRIPYLLDPGPFATLLEPAALPAPRDLADQIEAALARPIGCAALPDLVPPTSRVTIVVSDATRNEPRRLFLEALVRQLPDARWTVAIATGTHGPSPLAPLDLPLDLLGDVQLINHDGHSDRDLIELGRTSRGTPVWVHRCVVDTDLIVATGCIVPHYFAGFGAGAKAIFPGLGAAAAIRVNHALKLHPGARAGVLDGNPCRDDLDEAVRKLPGPMFLLDGVGGPDGLIHAVVAGDVFAAFRAGAQLATQWFRVRAVRAGLIVASDVLPVTASLYQAAKIAAAVAPLVREGGTLVIVAECPDGIGPLDVVNEAIFRIGILPRLAPGVSIKLVSALAPGAVALTLLEHAHSANEILRRHHGPALIIPRASKLLFEVAG
jgi:lactate racemase